MINKQILRLAIPAIISNITTPLLGLVDTAITGHLGAAVYLAAIAVGSTMFSMLYWLMNFLRMGSSGLTAQAYGAGDIATSIAILRRGMSISLWASASFILLSPWLADFILYFMDADIETTSLARLYFLIVIWGSPAVLATYTITGWMLGMQDTKAPMWMSIVTNVVNIIVSLVLVYIFGLKIEGVAFGTVVAQYAGLVVGLILMRRYHNKWSSKTTVPLKRFFAVNRDIFLRTLCLVTVTVWFTRSGAALGTDILAANALLMQLFILFSYFMDGFAFAGEALAGRYYGARDRRAIIDVVRGLFGWGAAVVVLFTLIYLVGGDLILRLLTDDYDVAVTASSYLMWAIAVPIAGIAAFVWDGVFIGMTMTRQMLFALLWAMLIYFALYFVLVPRFGNHGLWLAFLSYLLVRGIVQTYYYVREVKRV